MGSRVGNRGGHGHTQGGTHEEMPRPAILVVNGAARVLAEARVGFRVVKIEVVVSKVSELMGPFICSEYFWCMSEVGLGFPGVFR